MYKLNGIGATNLTEGALLLLAQRRRGEPRTSPRAQQGRTREGFENMKEQKRPKNQSEDPTLQADKEVVHEPTPQAEEDVAPEPEPGKKIPKVKRPDKQAEDTTPERDEEEASPVPTPEPDEDGSVLPAAPNYKENDLAELIEQGKEIERRRQELENTGDAAAHDVVRQFEEDRAAHLQEAAFNIDKYGDDFAQRYSQGTGMAEHVDALQKAKAEDKEAQRTETEMHALAANQQKEQQELQSSAKKEGATKSSNPSNLDKARKTIADIMKRGKSKTPQVNHIMEWMATLMELNPTQKLADGIKRAARAINRATGIGKTLSDVGETVRKAFNNAARLGKGPARQQPQQPTDGRRLEHPPGETGPSTQPGSERELLHRDTGHGADPGGRAQQTATQSRSQPPEYSSGRSATRNRGKPVGVQHRARGAGTRIEAAAKRAGNAFSSLGSRMKGAFQRLGGIIKGAGARVMKAVNERSVVSTAAEIEQSYKNHKSESASEWMQNRARDARRALDLDTKGQSLSDIASSMRTDVGKTARQASASARANLNSAVTTASKAARDKVDEAATGVANAASDVRGAVRDAKQDIRDASSALRTATNDAVVNASQRAERAADKAASGVAAAADKVQKFAASGNLHYDEVEAERKANREAESQSIVLGAIGDTNTAEREAQESVERRTEVQNQGGGADAVSEQSSNRDEPNSETPSRP